jgi:glycosyltransferase involved in cell wall biosynthesis
VIIVDSHKLKVLMLLDKLNVGGTETYVIAVTKELLQQGIEVVIAGRTGALKEEFLKMGCPVYTKFPNRKKDIIKKLHYIIKKHRINLLHSHQTPSGLYAKSLSSLLKIPLVFTVHGSYYHKKSLKKILKPPTKTISVSPPIQYWLNGYKIKNSLIPNGIDTHVYSYKKDSLLLKEELGIPEEASVLVYAGRLAWEKGDICKSFIDAGLELRDVFHSLQLVIVGGGIHEENIKSYVASVHQKTGVKFIHQLGARKDMDSLYSMSDCVVGTGRVALEAMACERPVIAWGTRGLYGLVTPDHLSEAWSYYFGDHKADQLKGESLSSLLKTVLLSEDERKVWGQKGREFVLQNFNISNIVKEIVEFYRSTN